MVNGKNKEWRFIQNFHATMSALDRKGKQACERENQYLNSNNLVAGIPKASANNKIVVSVGLIFPFSMR